MAHMVSDLAKLPMFGTALIIAGSLALLGASEPVLAADARSITVSTTGADLATAAGRADVAGRVQRAARLVCATGQDPRSRRAERFCIDRAVAGTRLQIASILSARPIYASVDPRSPSATSPEERSVL